MVIQTYLGKLVDLTQPDPLDIKLGNLSHQLSRICRFAGATEHHYSVAQHSLLVSMLMAPDPNSQLAGLLHDGAEALTGDFLGPIKAKITELQQLDWKVQWCVYQAFGVSLTPELLQEIEIFDYQVLATEKRDLLKPSPPWPFALPSPLDYHIVPMSAEVAKQRFQSRAEELLKQMKPPF